MGRGLGHRVGSQTCTLAFAPPVTPSPWDLLLHGQELGVHALLLPLHQLHVGQQLGDTVLVNLYVLVLQGGHLGPHRRVSVMAPLEEGGLGHRGKGQGDGPSL